MDGVYRDLTLYVIRYNENQSVVNTIRCKSIMVKSHLYLLQTNAQPHSPSGVVLGRKGIPLTLERVMT